MAKYAWLTILVFGLFSRHLVQSLRKKAGTADADIETGEYCFFEFLNITCPIGSVADVISAQLGRMHIGRCVMDDYGSLGCQSSVKDILDRECGGRSGCIVPVSEDDIFIGRSPCPREFTVYLHVSHTCVSVTLPDSSSCVVPLTDDVVSTQNDHVTDRSTIINNHHVTLAREDRTPTLCGESSHPWLLPSHPGQRINITVQVFSSAATEGDDSPALGLDNCNVILQYTPDGGSTQVINTCVNKSINLVSTAHQVAISLDDGAGNLPYVLLEYEASSCSRASIFWFFWIILYTRFIL